MYTRKLRPWSLVFIAVTLISLSQTGMGQTPDPKTKASGSISGHVIVNGKAAAGMAIGAFGAGQDNPNRRIPTAQTVTDSEGFYRLAGLAAGNYQVTTFTNNLTSAETTSEYPYGFFYFWSSKGVLLAAGEEINDINLKLVRGGVITGRVTDAENKPLVEERITLRPIQESGSRANRPPSAIGQMYQTDDRGVYRIYGLPAGRYRVSVGADPSQGYLGTASGYYQMTYHPDVTDAGRATIIELAEGAEAANVDIRVGRYDETYSIAGRLVDSETGLPISGARLGVMITRGQQQSYSLTLPGVTGAEGKFSQQGFMPGRYVIYISSEPGSSEFYSDPVSFEIVDKNVSGLEIKGLQGLSVSGTIVPENMTIKELLKQVSRLEVSAFVSPELGRMPPTAMQSQGRGVVGADGSFQITGLRPGRVSLSVSNPNSAKRVSILRITHGGIGLSQGFEIQPGQPVSGVQIAVLYGTGVIRGSVRFEGGVPADVLRTEVNCYRQTPRSFAGGATTDARGHFLINGFAPGAYECGLQLIPGPGSSRRMPTIPQQAVNVVNDAEAELNFVVNASPKEGGP